MLEEGVGDRSGGADHEVGHAGRNARVGQALEHQDQGQWRLFGRAAHDSATHRQRWGDFAAG